MGLVTIISFDNYFDAAPAKSLLESHDIYCNLQNEHTATIDPVLKNSVHGVLLQVDNRDAEMAADLLIEYGYYKEPNTSTQLFEDKLADNLAAIGERPLFLRSLRVISVVFLLLLIGYYIWTKIYGS